MLGRLAALALCLLPLSVIAGCGNAAATEKPTTSSYVKSNRAPSRPSSTPSTSLPQAGVRDSGIAAPVAEVSDEFSPFTITCDHDGAHADSLILATALEVPPDAQLSVYVDDSIPREVVEISLTRCGGDAVPCDRVYHPRGWRIVPLVNLTRGEAYIIEAKVPAGVLSFDSPKLSRKVSLNVPRVGVLDAFDADLVGDGRQERVVVASDRVEVAHDGMQIRLALPDISTVKGVAMADYDLDGRQDLAVLGTDSNAKPVLHWLRNTSIDGSLSFQARRVALPLSVKLPISIHAIDVYRDGLVDLIVADFTGKAVPMLNRLRGTDNPDPALPFAAITPLDAHPMVGNIRSVQSCSVTGSGFVDLQVSGTSGSVVFVGTAAGFSPGHALTGHNGAASWAMGGQGELSMLLQYRAGVDIAKLRDGQWSRTNVLSLASVSVEAMAVGPSKADGASDVLLAYRDGDAGVLRRFAGSTTGFRDMNGRNLGEIGRVNAIRTASNGGLLVCTELGLWELEGDVPVRRVLSFDSRVIFDTPVQVAVLPPMTSYVLADVDGDGRLDVAGITMEADGRATLGVWVNRAPGGGPMALVRTFTMALNADAYSSLVSLDVNRDRLADVLLLPKVKGGPGLLFVAVGEGVLREESPGYLAATPDDSAGPPVVVDLNGDGFADLFWPTPTGSISFSNSLLPGERGGMLPASGAVLPRAMHPETGQALSMEAVTTSADFGTGRQSIVAILASGSGADMARHVAVYHNEIRYGRQTPDLREQVLEGGFEEIRNVVTGEFEPGHVGVAALCREHGGGWIVAVWTRLNSSWIRVVDYAGRNPSELQSLDVDNDGDADLVLVPSDEARSLVLYVNDGSGLRFSRDTISSASLAEARTNGPIRLARLQDLDGDGRPDMLAQAKAGEVIHSPGR